ncbi:hypothetical protein CF386_07995 [Paraphotobacterium marinum]|uniref:Uncharacterized protein n=1 Tax=Paraphotobacterium marinum TaxID=1755811 RepID=A0A220VFF8_9GAMM|nr:hypothetical protein [Paraphotobacterium marinum]ASK79000.1 hypothetical protein CF386_07995 [Paraphotobacterium marinum]
MAKDKNAPKGQIDMIQEFGWKNGHGGYRKGSGRKKREETVVLRIPKALEEKFKALIVEYKAKKENH